MFQVFTCLAVEHDLRLVILSVAVCFLASIVAVSLFHRVQETTGREQLVWLTLDSAAAGYGIWATHFIAMLAYDPGVGAGYNVALTILSLLFAIAITGLGLTVASHGVARWTAALGGAVVGLGIAVMHFTGMHALELPGRITWSPSLIAAAMALGVVSGGLALLVAVSRNEWWNTLIAAVLLAFAVVSTHFTAMGAVRFLPDPTRIIDATSLSSASLALVVAATAAIILGMCLVAAFSDRQSKAKLRQQKVLLDTALENMSQGLCMYDADGRIVLFNERYRKMIGLPADSLKDRTLLDLLVQRKASGEFAGDPESYFAQLTAKVREGKSNSTILEVSAGRTLRVVDHPMQGGGWVTTLEDLTDWQEAQARIAHMARHDALTDLPNRRLFREKSKPFII
jgi:PAS domain S-box-containing protein